MEIVKDIILVIILTVFCIAMKLFADKKCKDKFFVGYMTGIVITLALDMFLQGWWNRC